MTKEKYETLYTIKLSEDKLSFLLQKDAIHENLLYYLRCP